MLEHRRGGHRAGYVGIRAMIPDIRAQHPRDGPVKCGTQPADMSVITIVAKFFFRVAYSLRCWFSRDHHLEHETRETDTRTFDRS